MLSHLHAETWPLLECHIVRVGWIVGGGRKADGEEIAELNIETREKLAEAGPQRRTVIL